MKEIVAKTRQGDGCNAPFFDKGDDGRSNHGRKEDGCGVSGVVWKARRTSESEQRVLRTLHQRDEK